MPRTQVDGYTRTRNGRTEEVKAHDRSAVTHYPDRSRWDVVGAWAKRYLNRERLAHYGTAAGAVGTTAGTYAWAVTKVSFSTGVTVTYALSVVLLAVCGNRVGKRILRRERRALLKRVDRATRQRTPFSQRGMNRIIKGPGPTARRRGNRRRQRRLKNYHW